MTKGLSIPEIVQVCDPAIRTGQAATMSDCSTSAGKLISNDKC